VKPKLKTLFITFSLTLSLLIITAPSLLYGAKLFLNLPYDCKQIYKLDADSVFEIHQKVQKNDEEFFTVGTGFFIDQNGTAVTAYHIIEYFDALKDDNIVLNGDQVTCIDEILYIDEENDIAVFRVKNPDNRKFKYLDVNTTEPPETWIGTEVFIMGNNQTELNWFAYKSYILEYITDKKGTYRDDAYHINGKFNLDIALDFGDSGGPVLNQKNQVIGVTFARYNEKNTSNEITSLITPITVIDSILNQINN